jgi:hypothetical protein
MALPWSKSGGTNEQTDKSNLVWTPHQLHLYPWNSSGETPVHSAHPVAMAGDVTMDRLILAASFKAPHPIPSSPRPSSRLERPPRSSVGRR